MHSLFWKGMAAFLVVILVAVGTVALLTGRVTESAFRRYAITRTGPWEVLTVELAQYYEARGSWTDVHEFIGDWRSGMRRMRGREMGPGMQGTIPGMIDFRIVDPRGQIVADTQGPPLGTVSQVAMEDGVPIEVDGDVVGYLLPALRSSPAWPLDRAQATFLSRVRRTLWVGVLAALGVALLVGGLLFQSITAPLRELTDASEAIADGDLSARAAVQGNDEVARLADAFNSMAESLHRMEVARRSQTADIAHELRTPLTVLQGTLEAMLDGVYPTDRENLAAALRQTRTLSRLIEDLRLLALADAGKLTLERGCLDLEAFLTNVVDAYQPRAAERGVALTVQPLGQSSTVCVDLDRLTQVMGNLLSNSLRHVPAGGHIRVEATQSEDRAIVSVIDDGPGVDPKELPHLFERFWRADRARQRTTGGSGLGLSIAAQIVEAHGGQIWAEPTPGGGLTVRFSLPLALT